MTIRQLSTSLQQAKEALLHLAFPHVCEGCATDALDSGELLCLRCLDSLPKTNFHLYPNNPVEKLFWGRLPLLHATALFYFTKGSLVQELMHQLKYKGNRDAGLYLGRLMGQALADSNRFRYVSALVPLPLHRTKEIKRGYNQAAVLCEGMASVMDKPVLPHLVQRSSATQSQTRKSRIERWQNQEGNFLVRDNTMISGKHLLLVDDVVTTGATLEACGSCLLQAKDVRLSVATLCFSSH